jgi:AcrR family transcriptional regulator
MRQHTHFPYDRSKTNVRTAKGLLGVDHPAAASEIEGATPQLWATADSGQAARGTGKMAPMAGDRKPTPRVARRRGRTRERLVASAAQIIATHGAEGLRLRDVAEGADIAVGSFYQHFESKDELIAEVVTQIVERLASSVIAGSARLDDPAESTARSHRWFIGLATHEPQLARLIVNLEGADVRLASAIQSDARRALQRGIDSGRFPAMDVDATITFAIGATIAVMRGVLDGRLDPSVEGASVIAFLGALGIDRAEATEIVERSSPPGDRPR